MLCYYSDGDIAIRCYYSVPAESTGSQDAYSLHFKNIHSPLDHFLFESDFKDWQVSCDKLTAKAFRLLNGKLAKEVKPISSDFFYIKSPQEAKTLIDLWKRKKI